MALRANSLVASDSARVWRWADSLRTLDRLRNAIQGLASDCALVTPPLIRCENGSCITLQRQQP